MQKLLLAVDRLSTFIGKTFAWTAALLTVMISRPSAPNTSESTQRRNSTHRRGTDKQREGFLKPVTPGG